MFSSKQSGYDTPSVLPPIDGLALCFVSWIRNRRNQELAELALRSVAVKYLALLMLQHFVNW